MAKSRIRNRIRILIKLKEGSAYNSESKGNADPDLHKPFHNKKILILKMYKKIYFKHCCGSGSGDPVPFQPMDPGSGMDRNEDPDPGSMMIDQDHIS
jgi:hypothetical protein